MEELYWPADSPIEDVDRERPDDPSARTSRKRERTDDSASDDDRERTDDSTSGYSDAHPSARTSRKRARIDTRPRFGAFRNTNPHAKAEINEHVTTKFEIPLTGYIVLLDAEYCDTSHAFVRAFGESIVKRLILPQRDADVAAVMRQHYGGLFADCVRDGTLVNVLDSLPADSIAYLYADFCGQLSEVRTMLAVAAFWTKFVPGAYLSVTIARRNYARTRYENETIVDLVKLLSTEAVLHSTFILHCEINHVYGMMVTEHVYIF